MGQIFGDVVRETVVHEGRTLYKLSAHETSRFFEQQIDGLIAANGRPGAIQAHHTAIEILLVAMSLRPGYPDMTLDEVIKEVEEVPRQVLEPLFSAAADLNGIDYEREIDDLEAAIKKSSAKSHPDISDES